MPTNYKNPLPAFQACSTIHGLVHGRHHEACKHTSRLSYRSKNGYSFRNLGWFAKKYGKSYMSEGRL